MCTSTRTSDHEEEEDVHVHEEENVHVHEDAAIDRSLAISSAAAPLGGWKGALMDPTHPSTWQCWGPYGRRRCPAPRAHPAPLALSECMKEVISKSASKDVARGR